jgi:hypothetical protein
VVPIHGRGDLLEPCLDAIGGLEPPPDEVVVVADGEDPALLEHVERRGFRLLCIPDRAGAAAARNVGAASTSGELVLFIDADVVVPRDTIDRVSRVFDARPGIAAVFGSYDDHPPEPGLVSRFKNLLHHWTHQRSTESVSTFWTGCGAIRRAVFMELGGFDPHQRWLEDVDLGYRLQAAGERVVLDRSLQVTHLKRWTLPVLAVSDICHRALPWSKLAVRYRRPLRELNGDVRGRTSVGLAGVVPLFLVAGAVLEPWLAAGAAAALAALLAINLDFYRLLLRRGGPPLMVGGFALHWLSLLAGGSAYALGSIWWRLLGARPLQSRGRLTDVSSPIGCGTRCDQVAASRLEGAGGSTPTRRRRSA